MKYKSLLVLFVAVNSVALGEINLKVGDPESQVEKILGKPSSKLTGTDSYTYFYNAETVVVKAGTVKSISDGIKAAIQSYQELKAEADKQSSEGYVAEQKAKGLVWYGGRWQTEEAAAQHQQAYKKIVEQAAAEAEEQTAKGRVLYCDKWVTPEEKHQLEQRAEQEGLALEKKRLAQQAEKAAAERRLYNQRQENARLLIQRYEAELSEQELERQAKEIKRLKRDIQYLESKNSYNESTIQQMGHEQRRNENRTLTDRINDGSIYGR